MSTSPEERDDEQSNDEQSNDQQGDDQQGNDQQGHDQQQDDQSQQSPHIMVVGPDGMATEAPPSGPGSESDSDSEQQSVTELVEQPAKVMRIGSMVKQLLDEVKSAPLDEASRQRLKNIHRSSVSELEKGLAPELVEELERLSLPFTQDEVPTDAELRISQAQLVGWLEGLFHGIQTALFAQQMASRAQLEQMRRSLPPGSMPPGMDQPDQSDQGQNQSGRGMYL